VVVQLPHELSQHGCGLCSTHRLDPALPQRPPALRDGLPGDLWGWVARVGGCGGHVCGVGLEGPSQQPPVSPRLPCPASFKQSHPPPPRAQPPPSASP
jgi:hypothetical protein